MTKKQVYLFGMESNDGNSKMKDLLGGKGANLAEIANLGIAVPPGFTITTEVCNQYYKESKKITSSLINEVKESILKIEKYLGRSFGDPKNPLLVSVRSGAKISMPGMMDTILNLGLNDLTTEGLKEKSNNPRFAYDSYRRFIQMYSNVVLKIDPYLFEDALDIKKRELDIVNDTDLSTENLKEIIEVFKEIVRNETGNEFPQDTNIQLWKAIEAVFDSWMCHRAITYRKINNIPENLGTAVNIQSMVFGNTGDNSATGVVFTRNPTNGNKEIYGEYLVNAQGEDVVAGIRTPQNITIAAKNTLDSNLPAMEEVMPEKAKELIDICKKLEKHFKEMQDIEFTIEDGRLWILQTRTGKRTAKAAVKIAVDLVKEGLITKHEALLRIDPLSLDKLLHPAIDESTKYNVLTKGLPASPGAATGKVIFSSEKAVEAHGKFKVILVRTETSPEDIHGMNAAEGILTSRGGMTSHAAVVARGMGKPCICGAKELHINYEHKSFIINGQTIKEGDTITISGSTGEVILGDVKMTQPDIFDEFSQIISWANEIRKLKVRANAETKIDSEVARNFGAEGIGLCRTEHMFFENDRINPMREMILAESTKQRKYALEKLLPMQIKDFVDLFKVMKGLPVTIRLLDPPLHEFLPHSEQDMKELARQMDISIDQVKTRASSLKEHNPMLGHRGCRLAITYPEICEMQARAIFEAISIIEKENPGSAVVEIMIPLIFDIKELDILKDKIELIAKEVSSRNGLNLKYLIGTMIELPRAALKADSIAHSAEFFSFGTNDLTQTTLGISRDDAGNFLSEYKEKNILASDPFVSLDIEGVGELIKIAVSKAKKIRPNIKIGICGEHGGDPLSIDFFHKTGFDYISCSPYRVPIAIIAAAQAAIRE